MRWARRNSATTISSVTGSLNKGFSAAGLAGMLRMWVLTRTSIAGRSTSGVVAEARSAATIGPFAVPGGTWTPAPLAYGRARAGDLRRQPDSQASRSQHQRGKELATTH